MNRLFVAKDILIPKDRTLLPNWSVIACDQFTSDPAYWATVASLAENRPSTYHLICPECGLAKVNLADKAEEIRKTSEAYLAEGLFEVQKDALIYVRRYLEDGTIREGIVGGVDLEAYSYEKGQKPAVRATEETVVSRLPARVAMRRAAAIELPHLLLLVDDEKQTLIETAGRSCVEAQKLYDFELMQNGGRIEGYLLDKQAKDVFLSGLAAFADAKSFAEKYDMEKEPVMALAVGDGNHSLAAAKQLYEERKATYGFGSAEAEACRYPLAELENLHQPALKFAPIHRVVFHVNSEELLDEMRRYFKAFGYCEGEAAGQSFTVIFENKQVKISLKQPPHRLAVGSLQAFLDDYVAAHPEAEIDYIHGEKETEQLAGAADAVGFLLPVMEKKELYPTVLQYGALPRKTFSMGHAKEKRYYLEAAEILPKKE